MLTRKEHDALTYTEFYFRGTLKETPPDWISLTPVKFLGLFIGWNLKRAKDGYPWQNN